MNGLGGFSVRDDVPLRAFKLLGGDTRARDRARESSQFYLGPPDAVDAQAIQQGIIADLQLGRSAGRIEIADAVSQTLLSDAVSGWERLLHDGPHARLPDEELVALEAVMRTRGRPALRVKFDELETLALHPGGDIWRTAFRDYENDLVDASARTAAVTADLWGTTVFGSAWLVREDLAITNRHVLIPDTGPPLARRRVASPLTATPKRTVNPRLNFSHDDSGRPPVSYEILDVPYIASRADPADIALMRVQPLDGVRVPVTTIASLEFDVWSPKRVFVIGHPGLLDDVPPEVQAVFGTPDGKKRVSFGEMLGRGGGSDLRYDASTIGGYSGGLVGTFGEEDAIGLHYWGDATEGNRAVAAAMLHAAMQRVP